MTTGTVPRRRSSFVGREADVEGILGRLATAPAVTLTGIGGVGKTRLALEVAAGVEASGERRVHVVELASTESDDAVARVVADALGLPVADTDPISAIAASLGGAGPVLLVLDNCEQVLDGAATLVDELLDRCEELIVLATSRERLGVDGEHVWPVRPLDLAAAGGAEPPAVRLLRERAEAARPTSGAEAAVLAQVAERLDGVPLALELAAARLATMDASELLEQLERDVLGLQASRRGRDDRHQSLAAMVEWSYRLLPEDVQRVFVQLAVFTGGFQRDDAVRVCGPAASRAIDHLVDASLLTPEDDPSGTRYRMLSMIDDFASTALDASDDATDLRRAHARWAATFAGELQLELRSPAEGAAVLRLDAELPNIGAALRWACDESDAELAVAIVRNLHDLVLTRGSRELHTWIVDAAQGGDVPDELLALAAAAALRRGDLPTAQAHLDRVGTPVRDADIWFGSDEVGATLRMFGGDFAAATAVYRAWVEGAPHDYARTFAQVEVAMSLSYAGETVEAVEVARVAAERAAESGNPTLIAWSAYGLAEALVAIDPTRAIEEYGRALECAVAVDSSFVLSLVAVSRASALARHGEPLAALDGFAEAIDRWRTLGAWSFQSTTLRNLGELLVRVERFEEAATIRAAVAALEASSQLGGVDAERDQYLVGLLRDRLGRDRYELLVESAARLTAEEVTDLAVATIVDEQRARRSVHEFRAIVFTDLEGSTSFLAAAGDASGRAIMRRYDTLTDELLARHRGQRIKGTGDGVLATFPTVTDALRCVSELRRALDAGAVDGSLPLGVRVGVHAGESIIDWGDVHGTVVNLTARVVDRAQSGEVLVTDTVRQIVVGGDFAFTPIGEVELKGIPEPMRLHRLELG